jgi:hypothetical protein
LIWREFQGGAEQFDSGLMRRAADASLDGGDGAGAESGPLSQFFLGQADVPAGAPQEIGKARLYVWVTRCRHCG